MSSTTSKNASARLARYAKRYARLKAELRALGYVCVGSVQSRRLTCGNPGCRCHTHERYRHGPYHYWTRKVGGKTVSAVLTADQAADILSVSPTVVARLLDEGEIPCRGADSRRIRAEDLLAYRTRMDARMANAADELTREAEDLGLDC